MKVPADKLLAELIIKHKHAIWKIHDHDSLLEHQVDQEISGNIANGDYPLIVHKFTEVRFARFFSGGFITTISSKSTGKETGSTHLCVLT